GANLAMEHVDAELHGWTPAPFATKAAVDANYKRMLDVALSARYADAVRVGVASHNIFDVAWALTLRKHLNAEHRVEIEMLEGMAPPQSSAVASYAGGLLLYGPATRHDSLDSAVAYLARRLDENAAPDNFLHALFSMKPGDAEFEKEKARFLQALDDRHLPPSRPRRTLDRRVPHPVDRGDGFFNEPDTDFTSAVNRAWIHDALDHWVAPEPNGKIPTVEDVDAAVEAARIASDKWRGLSREERKQVLRKVADEMVRARGETIAAMANTTGKVVAEGDTEVSEAIDFARYYAEAADLIDELEAKGAHFEPHRVTVVAAPWNFPYAIPAGGVLAALAAGSSVILKPAPQSRLIGQLVVEHCRRGGVPDDAVQFLPCDDDHAGKHLITHDDVNAVILTGSWDTAKMFRSWKPQLALSAETSGKNAIVITAAADLDAAVRDLVRSAFGNAGQKCSAASLAIVEASVYDDPRFVQKLADAVRSLRVGAATSVDTFMGPLIEAPSANLLRALTKLDDGETWLVEPHRLGDTLWTPGVKLGVKPRSWFHFAECFGPVLGLMRAESLEHAINLQNATPFGLTAGLHSLDPTEITRWVDRVDAGNLYVNRHITGAIVNRQPFGGWKKSVMGPATKAGGPNYVLTMGRWTDDAGDGGERTHDYEQAWAEHFGVPHDPSGLTAETNDFRYIPYYRPVVIRAGEGSTAQDVERARQAAQLAGVTVIVARDSDDDFIKHVRRIKPSKVRVLGRTSNAIYKRCDELGIAVDDSPVTSIGRLELQHWVHEQVVSITRHRYGNVRKYNYLLGR
ncbi:MAG: proline dehydrogenase family protein, partial [Acidimicrobiales bacterium]|nr:proline dehydrogenase family protein [Acidimicrobiales bacterium]